jgi:hypothetical protein
LTLYEATESSLFDMWDPPNVILDLVVKSVEDMEAIDRDKTVLQSPHDSSIGGQQTTHDAGDVNLMELEPAVELEETMVVCELEKVHVDVLNLDQTRETQSAAVSWSRHVPISTYSLRPF